MTTGFDIERFVRAGGRDELTLRIVGRWGV